ncbi:MAG: hypothetical protein PUI39_04055, partial [Prevotella sp.]|nr:hypothetical protein [Prevotella sp.]
FSSYGGLSRRENMDADHQKSAFASKRGVPKCPFGELYVLHFQTDDFLRQNFAENRKSVA